jgi:hypothetical protein
VADRDDVVLGELGLVDPGAADVRAVVAAQIDDPVAVGRRALQLRVLIRHAQVRDDDIVAPAAADSRELDLDLDPRGRVAEHAQRERSAVRSWVLLRLGEDVDKGSSAG